MEKLVESQNKKRYDGIVKELKGKIDKVYKKHKSELRELKKENKENLDKMPPIKYLSG